MRPNGLLTWSDLTGEWIELHSPVAYGARQIESEELPEEGWSESDAAHLVAIASKGRAEH